MNETDLEALGTPRIREAIQAAVDKVGKKDYASISSLTLDQLSQFLNADGGYIPVAAVTLACQVNKTHGDVNLNHTSVTECLKGSIVRLAQQNQSQNEKPPPKNSTTPRIRFNRTQPGPLYDQKTFKLLNFGGNTITLLLLGYFLGGIALAPVIGLPACVGVNFSPLAAAPCLGSIIGVVIGAVAGLGYTVYYFIRKM